MTYATSEQIRQWTGPAAFSFGFRPFCLIGAVLAQLGAARWAGSAAIFPTVSGILWIAAFQGCAMAYALSLMNPEPIRR